MEIRTPRARDGGTVTRGSLRVLLGLTAIAISGGCSKSAAEHNGAATLGEMDRALAMWTMAHGKPPVHVYELTNLPVLQNRTLPVPPAGKKLALDVNARHVVFVPE